MKREASSSRFGRYATVTIRDVGADRRRRSDVELLILGAGEDGKGATCRIRELERTGWNLSIPERVSNEDSDVRSAAPATDARPLASGEDGSDDRSAVRKLKVRHQVLPGIGDRFQLPTAAGMTVTVISHRSGRRDIAIGNADADAPLAIAGLTRSEAVALAVLLTGAHIEVTTTDAD